MHQNLASITLGPHISIGINVTRTVATSFPFISSLEKRASPQLFIAAGVPFTSPFPMTLEVGISSRHNLLEYNPLTNLRTLHYISNISLPDFRILGFPHQNTDVSIIDCFGWSLWRSGYNITFRF